MSEPTDTSAAHATVQTVTGPIAVDLLGITLVHEHLLTDVYENVFDANRVLIDERVAIEELLHFRNAGGSTIVEQTSHGLNPDPDGLQRISVATGVNIVAATGAYWRRFHPAWMSDMSESALADRFTRDLTEGMGVGRIRAGIIGEIATGHREIAPAEARVFRASAAAHRTTGAPIATHAVFTRIGLDQLELLVKAGVDPGRVLIGHADTCEDRSYHLEIVTRGAWIGLDSIGQTNLSSDEWRVESLVELASAGFLGQILLSSDVCKRTHFVRNGGHGYAHILRDFVPRLRAHGFTNDEIDQLLVVNPRRYLGGR